VSPHAARDGRTAAFRAALTSALSAVHAADDTMHARSQQEKAMRALFVGGAVDNSELDMDGGQPPVHYPPDTGGGASRYNLHHVGRRDGEVAYAVYAAPDLANAEVERIAEERGYARRFEATPEIVAR